MANVHHLPSPSPRLLHSPVLIELQVNRHEPRVYLELGDLSGQPTLGITSHIGIHHVPNIADVGGGWPPIMCDIT